MFQYARIKHLYPVAIGVLFLGMLLSMLAWSAKAHATTADSILAVSVQPYQSPFSVYEVGQAYSQVIANGTDYLGPGDPITATINWGDKTSPTQETFIDGGQHFQLSGTHAYKQVGKYTVTVTIAITVFQQSATGTGVINAVPAYALNAKHITTTTGKAFNAIVATGTDPFSTNPVTGTKETLMGTVNWGDNSTPTSVQVSPQADGAYQVNAKHTYSQTGSWTITISLTSYILGPITATGTATTTRLPQAYKLSVRNINARAGRQFCSTIALVTGTISKKGLSITIDWGDGTTSTLKLKHGKGTFHVKSCHTYTNVVSYPIVIDAQDNGTSQTATATSTATVA